MLRRWKRKGGEGGTPGDYAKLIEQLSAILDDDELSESLKRMLEGEGDEN